MTAPHDPYQYAQPAAGLPQYHGLQVDPARQHWQDDDRRKSMKLSTTTAPDHAATYSWAHGGDDHVLASSPATFASSSSGAHPSGSSAWSAVQPSATQYYATHTMQNSYAHVGDNGQATTSTSASAFTHAVLPQQQPQQQHQQQRLVPPPNAYMPYYGVPSAYIPYNSPASRPYTYDPSAGAPYTSSPSIPSSSSYSQYSYLPTPHSQFQPTPTIPPQVVQSAPSYPNTTVSPISPTFPIDASTPYMPAASDEVSQVVLVAAANRDKLGKIDLTGHSKQDDAPNRRATTCQSTRRLVELDHHCQACGRKIGRLMLRGGPVERSNGDDPSNYVGAFYCSVCVAVPPSSGGGIAGRSELAPPHPHNIYAGEATYYDTLTATVDRYQGIDPKQQDIRPPPAPPGKTRSGFTAHVSMPGASKKRRQSVADDAEGVLACDVCRRDIGSGTLQLASTGEPVGATVEVICAHCEVRYTRCSDCGGGGGSKGDVWTVASIPAERITEVVDICRDLYFGQLLGTLAVPDMLESVAPIARSFHEVEKLAVDSWTHFEPFITDDVETATGVRRYVALRWARPISRKKRSKKKAAAAAAAADGEGTRSSPEDAKSGLPGSPSEDDHDDEPQLIREGKVLTGFILAEQELERGILHVVTTLPTGAGEAYDASTRLLQTLVARVHEDTHMLNEQRASMQLAPYPTVTVAWTMHMTKRDSRIMSRLETRRGFIPLEDFLVKYPETNKANFPPIRKTYLPPESSMDTTRPAHRPRVACDESVFEAPLPTILQRRGSVRPSTAASVNHRGAFGQLEAGAGQGGAAGSAGGGEMNPRQDEESDLPTLQKKGFLARIRLKLGHSGEAAVTPANLNPAVGSPDTGQPPASIPPSKIPPFRRAASGPARLLDRNHQEQQRRVRLRGLHSQKKQLLTNFSQNARIAVEVEQDEESDRASTPPDDSTLPICYDDGHCEAPPTETAGDVLADPPSTTDAFERDSLPASGAGPGLVSSFPAAQDSPTVTSDITRSLTRSTSSSPTPRAAASGSSSIECFHPFLGAPIYDGPLRAQTRPSSMQQQAYGASWTGLSLGLAPSEHTAGVLSAASTSSRNNRAYSDVWPPPGLVSRFSDWTPTEPERRSSYHSSVFASLIARHDLGLSSISLHEEYWPPNVSPAPSESLGVVRHPAASNRDFRPLLTQSSRQRILSLRKKRSAAALVDWPSLETTAPTATQPRYPSITSRSRLPLWPYSLSSRSPSRKTAEPSVVCAREDQAWLRESRPASKKLKTRKRMVSVGVQTE
ncbi:putative Microtubule-associated protein [Rhodotorula toruloides ATCC 204091]|uniref:Putative microtubule-associated protein n=1 Tax=Rhodotorula toruloides TaxID=5286 RepID=A0A0K3CM56_RHOTO|nr:putative Microtubule-associated protein [Rhodotorula toruloides ATCC 204091]PRQ70772.1 putative microtubule-associated protein [Rhodotorula toruloides]